MKIVFKSLGTPGVTFLGSLTWCQWRLNLSPKSSALPTSQPLLAYYVITYTVIFFAGSESNIHEFVNSPDWDHGGRNLFLQVQSCFFCAFTIKRRKMECFVTFMMFIQV